MAQHLSDSEAARGVARRRFVVLGAFAIVLAGASLIVFAGPAFAPAPEPSAPESSAIGDARRASPDEVRAYLNDMFDRLDRDGSGHVEPAEAPRRQVTSVRANDGTVQQLPLTQAEWMAQGDEDRDGRVSRTEFLARLVPPVQAIYGVPPGWQPEGGGEPPPSPRP